MVRLDDKKIIQEYLDDLELQGKSPRTVEDYRSSVRIYYRWLHEKNLHIIEVNNINDKKIVEDFIKYLRTEHTNHQGG
jgi:site-specific recombinase XerD